MPDTASSTNPTPRSSSRKRLLRCANAVMNNTVGTIMIDFILPVTVFAASFTLGNRYHAQNEQEQLDTLVALAKAQHDETGHVSFMQPTAVHPINKTWTISQNTVTFDDINKATMFIGENYDGEQNNTIPTAFVMSGLVLAMGNLSRKRIGALYQEEILSRETPALNDKTSDIPDTTHSKWLPKPPSV